MVRRQAFSLPPAGGEKQAAAKKSPARLREGLGVGTLSINLLKRKQSHESYRPRAPITWRAESPAQRIGHSSGGRQAQSRHEHFDRADLPRPY